MQQAGAFTAPAFFPTRFNLKKSHCVRMGVGGMAVEQCTSATLVETHQMLHLKGEKNVTEVVAEVKEK